MKKLNAQNMTWIDTEELTALRAENEQVQAEIARLTPRMVREMPKVEGWYQRAIDDDSEIEIVQVRQGLDGRLYLESTDDDGTLVIDLVLHGKWWSAEPIPMPVIEKEETE